MRVAVGLAVVVGLAGCATAPTPTVEFPLSTDVLQSTVGSHRKDIRTCWSATLARHPNARGEVVLAFRVEPSGIVNDLRVVRSTVKDDGLGTCLLAQFRQWQFPTAKVPTVVAKYAIVFRPGEIQILAPE